MDISRGQSLFQPADRLRTDLLYRFQGSSDLHGAFIDPGNGQEVFYHIKEPVGVIIDVAY